jgi:hypothetical protein
MDKEKYFDPKPGFNWVTGWFDTREEPEPSTYYPHFYNARQQPGTENE